MIRSGTFGRQKKKDQIDRLIVERFKIDRRLEAREYARDLVDLVELSMRDGDAVAHARRAEALALQEGERVIRLKRLRFIRDEPIVLGITHVPERFCPSLTEIDFSDKSFYRTLESKYGLVIATGIRTIEAVNASPEIAALLQIEPGAALSVITSIGYLKDGTPLEYFTSWHRGDRSRFEVRLVNPRA